MQQQETTTDEDNGTTGLILFITGLFCVGMTLLNGTPLGFIDDLVFYILRILFWPVVIVLVCLIYQEEKEKDKERLSKLSP